MKHDVDQRLQKAFNKIETPNVLDSILSDCAKQKTYVVVEKKRNNWIKSLSFALAAALIVSTIGLGYLFNSNNVMTTIAFDVNPSIELEMNKNEEIVNVNALNEDAKKILDGMDLKGVDLDVAVNALIGSMIKQGYLSDIANSILISVDSKDQETMNRLQQELMEEISELIQQNNLDGAILTQKIDTENEEIEELAQVYGITKAKTQLIKEILKTNDLHTFEDLVNLSINELNLISESQKESMSNITSQGSASEAKYIGKEKAKEIALLNANVNESNVSELEIELDYEMDTMVYEVEFEFNGIEYDYDINAIDGTILHVQKENEHVHNSNSNSTNNDSSNYIGKEKAKEIAFEHASINKDQVSELWVELEKDDGQVVYEVEFNVGDNEYDYEINALTGKIVDYEIDEETITTNDPTTYIGKEKAKQIALNYVNANASQISDYEIELQDSVYEINFDVEDVEYEFEINAITGKIVDYETEDSEETITTNNSTTYIEKSKAKEIALNYIGVKASQISDYEIELQDGIYEIDFEIEDVEYEFEIDATTGKIVDYEKETDD